MRIQYAVVFVFLILALAGCAVTAYRSRKTYSRQVSRLLIALLPPVIGNLIIIISRNAVLSEIGYYVYFIGMDCVVITSLIFARDYCEVSAKYRKMHTAVFLLCSADVIQFLLNPFLHCAFTLEQTEIEGYAYFNFIPHFGQTYHRILDYAIVLSVVVILFMKMIRTPRIYAERYSVVLAVTVLTALWQTIYIFSRIPINRSMLSFGFYGIAIFYFALFYRPMRLLDRMLANIASEMPEAVLFFDAGSRCIWANSAALSLLTLKENTLEDAIERLNALFGNLDYSCTEWCARRSIMTDGEPKYYVLEMHVVEDTKRKTAGSFLSIRDNTEEQLRLKKEFYNATHDNLTALYTKEYLFEQIRSVVESSPDTRFVVGYMDVKNFKFVNDVFSRSFGDYALMMIAAWIRRMMPEQAIYGRLGGDTFGICLPADALDRAAVEDELSRFKVKDGSREYHLLIHLGLYEITEPELSVSVMFDRAHLALTKIKEEYQTHTAYYDDALRGEVLWSQHISSHLADAIANRELVPYLQPIVDTQGRVVGAEALVRWIHPEDGFLPPGKFVPLLEKNGMIVEVDKYMWRCACEILARWKQEGRDLFLSVNISPKDFYFLDVNAYITDLVAEFGIEPKKLRIEITETVMMNESDDRMNVLSRFREAGFIVEMDDFGSGYSSLNLLKDMPVDVLKLDMKFLNRSENSEKAKTILRNIIKLSEELGITALTEGVETEMQYQMLLSMGCVLFQGYHFAKPMPAADFDASYS